MSDKYEFIDAEYATAAADTAPAPTITRMCAVAARYLNPGFMNGGHGRTVRDREKT